MPLHGTWLYLGRYGVLGGTEAEPDSASSLGTLVGTVSDYQDRLAFVEMSWTTDDSGTAFPVHNTRTDLHHSATYDLDGNGRPTTSDFATFLHYEVKLTFLNEDETTSTRSEIFTLRQMMNGDSFLTPSKDHGEPALTFTKPLLSVELTRAVGTHYNYRMVGARDFTPGGEPPPPIVPCFVAGTLIRTERGPIPVERIAPGHRVMTADHGLQTVRWSGIRRISATALARAPELRPIRIAAGSLGGGLPEIDLMVSPLHRMLVRSRIAQKMFGTSEVLVAAKQLLRLDGVDIVTDLPHVDYVHLMFDRHEVIFANGAPSESLYGGAEALRRIGPAARAEILTIFPELAEPECVVPASRPLIAGRQARRLAHRHLQNVRPLIAAI